MLLVYFRVRRLITRNGKETLHNSSLAGICRKYSEQPLPHHADEVVFSHETKDEGGTVSS